MKKIICLFFSLSAICLQLNAKEAQPQISLGDTSSVAQPEEETLAIVSEVPA